MDSLYTNARHYVRDEGHRCIAQIMAVAEEGGFRIYVAWEWKAMADGGVFGFCKSRKLYPSVTPDLIEHTADQGFDIGGTGEERKVFQNLFEGVKP